MENRIFALESHFKKTSVDDSLGKQKFALLPKIKPEQRFVNKAENNLITESDLEEETSVEASYMHSLNLLQANKSAEAKVQLEEALKENPKEDLKFLIYYQLGKIDYNNKEYKQASISFLKSYQLKPKSTHSQEILIKLLKSLLAIEQYEHACIILQKIDQDFSDKKELLDQIEKERASLLKIC